MNAPENLPDFEYEHKHHTMKWCIYESDETDKLSFKADGVADGIYTVEVVGLRNPWGPLRAPPLLRAGRHRQGWRFRAAAPP